VPTRKQRRREQKNRRHEYEYVYVDDEGHEVEVPEDEPPIKTAKGTSPAKQTAGKSPARQAGKQPARGAARKIDPPSWGRVFRRAAIFAPIMAIVVYYLQRGNDASILAIAFNVLALLLFFIPFSYFMDTMMYRNYRKRIGDPIPPRERKR
jgi:hypothetical protein